MWDKTWYDQNNASQAFKAFNTNYCRLTPSHTHTVCIPYAIVSMGVSSNWLILRSEWRKGSLSCLAEKRVCADYRDVAIILIFFLWLSSWITILRYNFIRAAHFHNFPKNNKLKQIRVQTCIRGWQCFFLFIYFQSLNIYTTQGCD